MKSVFWCGFPWAGNNCAKNRRIHSYCSNPSSAKDVDQPAIGKIKPELVELVETAPQVVPREGNQGAGFTSGNRRNKVRFIRLRYAGGDWDQDLDLNSDLNRLAWHAANTGHEIAAKPKGLTPGQLARLPIGKSPPWFT
jgi:hypothetical protein